MTFDIEKTIAYWVEGAGYDLETGRSLLAAARNPHALFFGHLALEKMLKAHVVRATGQHAPFTHSLPMLAAKLELGLSEKQRTLLAEVSEFHLEARYPDQKGDFYKRCTPVFTRRKFKATEEMLQWLGSKLQR